MPSKIIDEHPLDEELSDEEAFDLIDADIRALIRDLQDEIDHKKKMDQELEKKRKEKKGVSKWKKI